MSAPRVYTERFGQAMAWAHAVHLGHLRKGTDLPYVSHLISVAALVMEHGGTEDEAIGALLHDAIEDRSGDDPEGMKREISGRFGEAVLAIVVGCSDADSQTEKDRENGNRALWQSRKDAYVAHLRAAPAPVRLVSMCDKLHNARAILADYRRIGEQLWARFNGGREGMLWYYRALIGAYREAMLAEHRPPDALMWSALAEIERTVAQFESLAAAATPG